MSFIISNNDKHEFSRIWKRISYSNDVMNHADCVIKRYVYPQKMHSCSKNICGISFFVLKVSVVYQKTEYMIMHVGIIARIIRKSKDKKDKNIQK